MNDELDKFESFLLLKKNLSNQTIQAYSSDIELFEKYLKNNNKDIYNANNEDLYSYLSSLNLKNKSFNRKLTSISEFYKFLLSKDKKIKVNIDKIRHVKNEKIYPKIIKKEEINRLIQVQENNLIGQRNQIIILFLYVSGLRVSELISLTYNDLNFKEGSIRCIGKGDKEKIVIIGDLLKMILYPYQEIRTKLLNHHESKYVFINKNQKPLTRQYVYQMIKKSADKANIKLKVSPHTLRHCFATHMLENGADLISVQEMLGHANVATTQIYLNVANNKIKEDYFKKFKDPLKEVSKDEI